MPESIAHVVDPELYTHCPGSFIALSADPDLDGAFDDSVDTAWYEYGHSNQVPSIAQGDPGDIEVVDPAPITRALALAQAQTGLLTATPGVVYARPLCSDGTYRRRRVSLVITDPTITLPTTSGPVTFLDLDLRSAILDAAEQAGVGPESQELLEAVDIRTHRQRFKPVATPNAGSTERVFEAIDPVTRHVVASGPTAGAARREAVAAMKAGLAPGNETDTYTLEIYQRVGRVDGLPLISIERVRVTQRASLRLSYLTLKNPDKDPKIVGWLFYGIVAPAQPETSADDEIVVTDSTDTAAVVTDPAVAPQADNVPDDVEG
jgi:hypothetical protein